MNKQEKLAFRKRLYENKRAMLRKHRQLLEQNSKLFAWLIEERHINCMNSHHN